MRISFFSIVYFVALITGIFCQNSSADELKFHLIRPHMEINWSSPSSLAITSGMNSLGSDYAPIGHFAVELKCSTPNRYGIKHVLTGMERFNKKASMEIIRKNGLGLGSLVYPFKGKLQTSTEAAMDLTLSKLENRIKTVEIPITSVRCEKLMEFLDQWITEGSYQVYGGNMKTELGEGAGCADFARVLFEIATQTEAPVEWSAVVKVPGSLMGIPDSKVSLLSILFRKTWAVASEQGLDFRILDTDFTWKWLTKNGLRCGSTYLWTRHAFGSTNKPQSSLSDSDCEDLKTQVITRLEVLPTKPVEAFTFHYPISQSPSEIWKTIDAK
jgi:hypothetical protein